MYLTLRFFLILALLAVCSALGYAFPPLYSLAQAGVAALALGILLDFALLWLASYATAVRQCKPRFSNAEENAVSLRVENVGKLALRVTVRDELPRAFRHRRAVFPLRLKPGEGKTIRYGLRPTERGEYSFGHVLLFVRSRLGLIERKIKEGKETSVKVYPAYERLERYELAAVSLNLVEAGLKRIRRAGNNTDFEQIKDYVIGDDFRTLNWKASARAGRWMVNTYSDERAQPIWNVIDKGRAMQRSFRNVTLLDYAVNASLVLSYVALRRYDMAGLITFDSHIDRTVPAARRPSQLQLILEALYAQEAHYAESDYSALSVHLYQQVRRRSLIVLYTDFGSRDALTRQLPYLRRIAKSHALLVVFFEDEEVSAIAAGHPKDMQSYRLNALASHFCLEKQQLVAELRQCGIYALLTTPQTLSVDVVNKYIELKTRKAI